MTENRTEYERTRSFSVYNIYRLLLASLLLLLHYAGATAFWISSLQDWLFIFGGWLFLVFALIGIIQQWVTERCVTESQITTHLMVDTLALTLIMHASGGINSGMAAMLALVSATGAIMLRRQLALFVASVATISLFAEAYLLAVFEGVSLTRNLFNAGLMGSLCFFIAVTFAYLSERIRTSQSQVDEFAKEVQNIYKLNELIVARLRTGLTVLSAAGEVKLANQAAKRLLGIDSQGPMVIDDSAELFDLLQRYKQDRDDNSNIVQPSNTGAPVKISFSPISDHGELLVFVDDVRQQRQLAQSLKQRSLGALAANIAHEIRNPLSAISHSAQLLQESEKLDNDDKQLSGIIVKHTARVNRIIENVQKISRREPPARDRVDLNEWLRGFVAHFKELHGEAIIDVDNCETPLEVNVDTSQLTQVVRILAENAIRHSAKDAGEYYVKIETTTDSSFETALLRVIDSGAGVAPADRLQIFEPFYTSEDGGTGLGLYIAKDLCELNQAQLSYHPTENNESCFEILFSHPNRGTS